MVVIPLQLVYLLGGTWFLLDDRLTKWTRLLLSLVGIACFTVLWAWSIAQVVLKLDASSSSFLLTSFVALALELAFFVSTVKLSGLIWRKG